ncbi:MAG: hypothetical protein IJI37_04225, partial [Opitutales bacterium]|nr:hypothetical protein [Opitutales bacterium]
MKKSALTIALLSSLVLGAYADSQTFYGGKSRTTVSGTTAATDITLDSSGGDLYASANIAAHTVNIINGNAGFA